MKFILIILLIVNFYVYADEAKNTLDCKEQFSIAWQANLDGNTELSSEIVKQCQRELDIVKGWFSLLEAKLLFSKKQYRDTLSAINNSRDIIESAFKTSKGLALNNKNINDESQRFFYLQMLAYSGLSNYQLKEWKLAAKDFELYLKEKKESSYMQYLASCYSKLGLYKKSIEELKKSYKIDDSDKTSFYLAMIYSKINDIDNTIYWLDIAFHKNKTLVKEVDNESDFDTIKDLQKFQSFLKTWK